MIAINKQTRNKKIILIMSIVGIVTLCVGYLGAAKFLHLPPFSQSNQPAVNNKDTDSSKSTDLNKVDYSGPTQTDITESQNGKKQDNSDVPTPNTASVAVSYADVFEGNIEIRAFIPGVIEGDGTCTISLEQANKTVKREVRAFIDASSTQCTPVFIPVSELPSKGTWVVSVSYNSPSTTGSSEKVEIKL